MATAALYIFGLLALGSVVHLMNLWNLSFTGEMERARRERQQFQQKARREQYRRQQRQQYNNYQSYRYTRGSGQQSRNSEQKQRPPRRRFRRGADHYGNVLGIDPMTVQSDDLKKAYRRLVAMYHPDKVHHMGPVYREEAEKRIKEVNEAYDYFRKKYRV